MINRIQNKSLCLYIIYLCTVYNYYEPSAAIWNQTLAGVFGESVSVTEGDAVTLHTGLPEIQRDDVLEWRFGAEGALIAQINRGANKSNIYDGPYGRFRGRLKLDNQTGDLTIRNIRTEHSGLYEVTSNKHTLNKIFNVSVLPVDPVKSVSVLVGDSVTLTGVTEIQRDDVIQWRFEHQNSPIAEINRKARKVYKHDGADERFRHRLQLDYLTGSLTIRNIGTKHSGLYEVDISTSKHTIHKSFNVTVSGELRTVSVMEEGSVTLQTGLIEIQRDDFILWMFEDTVIAEIYKKQSSLVQQFYKYDGADERFRDRLQLNNQTGSLTITQCKTSNSGLYELKINSNRHAVHQRFIVTVSVSSSSSAEKAGISVAVVLLVLAFAVVIYCRHKISKLKRAVTPLSLIKGVVVTLTTDVELRTDDQILWTFGDDKSPIAVIKRGQIFTYEGADGRFRDRLQLDNKTGSLTITNTRTTDSGLYQLKIIRNRKVIRKTLFKRFCVTVFDGIRSVSVMEEESVTLNPDAELQRDDEILWMFGDTVLAETKGGTTETTTHNFPDGRFRDRLVLCHQTGSLTITNTKTEHTGEYKLKIIRSGNVSLKLFIVTVFAPTIFRSMPEERFLLQLVQ